MYHAIELLERHGIRVFLNYFDDGNNGNNTEEKFFVMKDANIKQFLNEVRAEAGENPFADQNGSFYGVEVPDIDIESIDFGHPKFKVLQQEMIHHFEVIIHIDLFIYLNQ